jgi:hypothetical protein
VSAPNVGTRRVLGELEQQFPGVWVLIGGLIVYLLPAEAGQTTIRVNADAFILIRVKVLTSGARQVSNWLVDHGLPLEGANIFEQGHRFSADVVSIDVQPPGGLGVWAERRTIGKNVAPEAEAGGICYRASHPRIVGCQTGERVSLLR